SQVSVLSRPSGKSIYLQRREYAKSVNKKMSKPQYRVEHLFTCDLDGNDLRSLEDCVDRLKLLDGMGDVWGQNMLLEMALSDILEIKSVLGAGAFKSLLILSVKLGRKKSTTTVFMFQCEDVGVRSHPQEGINVAAVEAKNTKKKKKGKEDTDYYSPLQVIHHCPGHLPPTIVAPLLTPQCIHLLSEEASTDEDQLWQTLGDAWSIPSWPGKDIPIYTLVFSDGWKPDEVSAEPAHSEPVSRRESPQPAEQRRMCAKSDFTSRNPRELSISKGETVQLLDTTKQWWKVRNSSGEEGYVPNNVFSSPEEQPEPGGSPVLTRMSTPVEVKAWLEDKGFSKITVRCLGVLKGSSLLGMSREELKMVCPEEGGRVFLQLQAVKSAGL
uniref:EPS8-like 3a n=1 Tax=Echeneis naucrates TaxID=173247 RepID=A0A665UK84_ECHNA